MGRRTNTAQWLPNQKRWQIKVQKDGQRRTFTSAKPGRTGQREANRKADAWLDDGICNTTKRCSEQQTAAVEREVAELERQRDALKGTVRLLKEADRVNAPLHDIA